MDQVSDQVRWGIIGCGDVTEVKSGPGLQKAEGSSLVAVMRRDADRAADYAARHGVARSYSKAEDLISDPEVNAVYVATPPSSHCDLALKVADAGKPCLVEKPMALNYAECQWMVEAFSRKKLPLFVAYYRRALPRFLKVKALLAGAIGKLTSVHIVQFGRLGRGSITKGWRYDPALSGGGLFFDVGSHGLELLLKPHGGISASADEMLVVVDRVDRRNFGICYDPGNILYYTGKRPEDDLPRIVEHVLAICLKDERGGKHGEVMITLGTGDVEFDTIFGILRDAEFNGPAWVEGIGGSTLEEINAEAANTMRFLSEVLSRP